MRRNTVTLVKVVADIRATFKLRLATNHKPVIRGNDPAIWDRIKLVPFDVRMRC